MLDYIKKGMFMGLGMATMTKDRIEAIVGEMRKYADLSEEEGRKMVDYLSEESKKTQSDLRQMVQGMVEAAVNKMPCARRIDQLEARLRAVEAKTGLGTPVIIDPTTAAQPTPPPSTKPGGCCGGEDCKK